MDRKAIMGLAAVAGIGVLLYLRKNGDSSAIASTGGTASLMGSSLGATTWAQQPIVINATTKPAVLDQATTPKAPAPAPASAPSGGFVIGGGATTPAGKGSGYYGAGGTEINDKAAVGRLDSIKGFVNTLDWGAENKAASAAALADAARQYGVGYREIAIASGYKEEDVARLFSDNGQTVGRF